MQELENLGFLKSKDIAQLGKGASSFELHEGAHGQENAADSANGYNYLLGMPL